MNFLDKNIVSTGGAILIATFLFPGMAAGESFNSKIEQANQHYKEAEYGEAASKFLSAEVDRPNNPSLAYNLANSNYKGEKYEEALEAYSRAEAVADDPAIKQKALYNTGNVLYRMGKPEEAVAAYKKALEIDPGDMDAKFNIEYIRDELKKQEQQQNQKNQNKNEQSSRNEKHEGDSSGKDEEKDKQDQENKKDGDQQTEQEPTDKQAQQKQQNEESKNKNDSSTPPPPDQEPKGQPQDGGGKENPPQDMKESDVLSEEDAERWLSSLDEDHKKFLKRQNQGKMKDLFNYKGNDW